MADAVLKDVLDHRHCDHEGERRQQGGFAAGVGNLGNQFHEHEEQEIEVGHFGKLPEEIFRQEGQASVLGCGDSVRFELAILILFIKYCVDLENALFLVFLAGVAIRGSTAPSPVLLFSWHLLLG